MRIAVIIAARPNAPELLAWTLEGFAGQRLSGHALEVRVGLDGLDTVTAQPVDAAVPISIRAFPKSGAAAIRNALVADVDCDLLIFGNADVRPDQDMVQQHADTIASLPPGSMVLGSAPWEKPAHATVFDALLAETPMIFFYNQLHAGRWYDFRHAWTLNLSMRTTDFRAAGGFPEKLRPVYYEDLALGFRHLGLERKGILYHPAARVLHRHPTTLEQYLDREELLGLMAPVLARECFPAFHKLFLTTDPAALGRQYEEWLRLDQSSHRFTFDRLREWAALPESAAGIGPDRERLLMTIYQMHIPLKRLAFRLGYLRGLDLADDTHWQKRQPQSLWRNHCGAPKA